MPISYIERHQKLLGWRRSICYIVKNERCNWHDRYTVSSSFLTFSYENQVCMRCGAINRNWLWCLSEEGRIGQVSLRCESTKTILKYIRTMISARIRSPGRVNGKSNNTLMSFQWNHRVRKMSLLFLPRRGEIKIREENKREWFNYTINIETVRNYNIYILVQIK